MVASLIVTFREVLEAALILGIIFTYVTREGRTDLYPSIVLATLIGVGLSVLGAVGFNQLAEGFSGRAEQLYEGIIMIFGSVLLTTMIIWMIKEGAHAQRFKDQISRNLTQQRIFSLMAIVTISILREGIELVIFLASLGMQQGTGGLWFGSIIGFLLATGLGLLMFIGGKRLSLRMFFQVTNVLLILFAGGMLAYGVHELQEAGVVPTIIEHLYDINPAVRPDGTLPLLHENGAIGSILKGLVGYNGNPSLIETLSYLLYLSLAGLSWILLTKDPGGAKSASRS